MKQKTDMKKVKETAQMLLCINIGKSELSPALYSTKSLYRTIRIGTRIYCI